MHQEINLYIKLMMDLKMRVKFINKVLNIPGTTGSTESDIEFCCLQLRKILELISLGSLVMNKEEFENQKVKFEKFWNAKLILNDIERLNPDFYPKPVTMEVKDGVTSIFDVKEAFFSKEQFVYVYDKCGKILHTDNPFGSKVDYEDYKKQVKKWGTEIINLVNLHIINLYKGDGFYLVYVYNSSDENVHATHYPFPID